MYILVNLGILHFEQYYLILFSDQHAIIKQNIPRYQYENIYPCLKPPELAMTIMIQSREAFEFGGKLSGENLVTNQPVQSKLGNVAPETVTLNSKLWIIARLYRSSLTSQWYLRPYNPYILLMEEILHQSVGSLSHYLQGFIHPRWLFWISSINRM